jgi:prophage maintenance system killer protein
MSGSVVVSGVGYLTVQDILWIHQKVYKPGGQFVYTKLEEATYLQYSYGNSTNIFKQAANLLVKFPKIAPFTEANVPTSFVAFGAFLRMNGYTLNLPDNEAAAWVKRAQEGSIDASSALEKLAEMNGEEGVSPEDAIAFVLESYPETIKALR